MQRKKNNSNPATKSSNKKIANATPIEAGGIKFRSKLELYTYRRLVEAGIQSEYEKHKYHLLEKFEFSGRSFESKKVRGKKEKEFIEVKNKINPITYTPDFVNVEDKWVIEVKGFANDAFPLKWKMFKSIMNKEGYTLYLPSNQWQVRECVEIIKGMNKSEREEDM